MVEKTIVAWHSELHERFFSLRASRDASSPGSPVFALEHGLDPGDELPELNAVVRAEVSGNRLSGKHWLPLVVYAAEIGYRYKGDEYWPVFEGETPGWKSRGSAGREYVRKKYELFAETYGGALPSGVWATWFKNIAWPITHAVLPADLQRHLARLLSDYRNAFTTDLLEDHVLLGERLAARASDTSTRFKKFAENTSLLGLVAASLLLGDEEATPLLSSEVLHRIVTDLSHERQAGAWLRDAKRAAVRVRRRGLLGPTASVSGPRSTDIVEQHCPSLELSLSLRRSETGWTAYIAVPSFEPVAQRFPKVRDELANLRNRIDGTTGVRARGSMMYELAPLALETMPVPNKTPIRVERASETLSALLVDHCRIPSPPWLFRVREPGLAKEVRTNSVRPGEDYILVSPELPETCNLPGADRITLTTQGIKGIRFTTPSNIDDALIATLRDVGLGLVSNVSLWPAGIVPASWDGEGEATWLAGEDPIIGIKSERYVARCVVSTSEDVMEVPWPPDRDTLFLQLTDLEMGTHSVEVLLFGADVSEAPAAIGQVTVVIREPADSASSASQGQCIQTWAYPPRPSLEELWGGDAALVVEGPHIEKVRFELRLMSPEGGRTLAKRSFSSPLPVDENRWRELLRGVQGERELQTNIGQAEELTVVISNPVLGSAEIRAERPFEPLRWTTGIDRQGPYARLIDHLDSDELQVSVTEVGTPDKTADVVIPEDRKVRSGNGLLVVAAAESFQAAVVLPPHVSGGLDEFDKLLIQPTLSTGTRSAVSVSRMVTIAHLWTRVAKPADQTAAWMQSRVNDAIVARLCGMIAGSRWSDLEQEALGQAGLPRDRILDAIGSSGQERATAATLVDAASRVPVLPEDRAKVFAELVEAHGWQSGEGLTELILRLCTAPGSVALTDTRTTEAISLALESPALVRLARLFALIAGEEAIAAGESMLEVWPWV